MLTSKKPNYERPGTVISKETSIETAKIVSKTSVQINGTLIGDANIEESLVIGVGGQLKGNIEASFVLVAGTINGNVHAREQIHVTKTAIITGDIVCGSIIIDDGAVINGNFKMVPVQPKSIKKD
jgi:cytoskeletal protein CcmA (bactofilin family)